jgi:hypothetical protein
VLPERDGHGGRMVLCITSASNEGHWRCVVAARQDSLHTGQLVGLGGGLPAAVLSQGPASTTEEASFEIS